MNWTEEQLATRNREVLGIGAPKVESTDNRDICEAFIQAECTKLLQEDDWRVLRTDPVSDRGRGKGFGEIGMADMLYMRYWAGYVNRTPQAHDAHVNALHLAAGNCLMWIEWKRSKGGKVSKSQRDWHTKERARGALTLIAGEDFPASIAGFESWYETSGLKRRRRA